MTGRAPWSKSAWTVDTESQPKTSNGPKKDHLTEPVVAIHSGRISLLTQRRQRLSCQPILHVVVSKSPSDTSSGCRGSHGIMELWSYGGRNVTFASIIVDRNSTRSNLLVLLGVRNITESYTSGEFISDLKACHVCFDLTGVSASICEGLIEIDVGIESIWKRRLKAAMVFYNGDGARWVKWGG